MASPKTVGQFYVETTQESARNAASAQDAIARYMDESAVIGRTLLTTWSSAQQSGLQAAFQLQNAVIEAAQTILDASVKANLSLYDEWAKAVAEGQAAAAKLVAEGTSMLDNAAARRSR